jgi:hypothetical protein
MANDKITIISGWIARFDSTERVIQLNRNALLIAQSDRLEWFDLFVTVRGVVMTKEVRIPSKEGWIKWRGRDCQYTIRVNRSDLVPADNIENSAFAGACSPLRLN